jgi:hypothetical protein
MKIVFKCIDSGIHGQCILIPGEKYPDTIEFLIVTFAAYLFYLEKEKKPKVLTSSLYKRIIPLCEELEWII